MCRRTNYGNKYGFNEKKRQKTKQQDKLKRPDKQIGEARKRIKQHKGGGLFDK